MSSHARRTDLTVGVLLVAAGLGLFLYAIDVIPFAVLSGSVWLALGIAGLVVVLNGWKDDSSILLFIGGLLLVAGIHTALWSYGILEAHHEEILPAILLWIGLASLFVWLPAPYKIDLLVPALLFGGCGLGYYLWWWDVIRMSDLKYAYGHAWPLLLILLGGGILFRSFRRTGVSGG